MYSVTSTDNLPTGSLPLSIDNNIMESDRIGNKAKTENNNKKYNLRNRRKESHI